MFYVNKHKTMYKYDPAVITLTPTEFEWLSIYLEKVRPQVSPSDEFFFSWTGKKMEAGAVSRQLCSLWIKIGILMKNDKNMSRNILCKSASTNREAGDPRIKEVSDLIAHSVKAAETQYVITKKQLSAESGSTALRSLSNFTKETEKQPTTSKRKLWNFEETLKLKKVCVDEINNELHSSCYV